jgi:RimJ/RimL family protein N-acetyltransferase
MAESTRHWTTRQRPASAVLEGRYVRIEPLSVERHARELFEASAVPDADAKFTWLAEAHPTEFVPFRAWVEKVAASEDPIYYAVIDKQSGRVAGRQTLMRIDTANGVVEIGNIYWGPLISRKRAATEALFLFARYVFDDLGYRRFEWKCNNDNAPSKKAARRFGFQYEGVFRQHMVVKGLNRDTAWFAMIDKDWTALRAAYEAWLEPSNFDGNGNQKRRLEKCRADVGA